ncbi:MAG: DUF3316 domain-containing protein [Dysgonamonadaceae bacterium]|jgi:hypothetical protein|nr:DUF3316 domain-containing protein [Dysgonamonadaceae bacterium]
MKSQDSNACFNAKWQKWLLLFAFCLLSVSLFGNGQPVRLKYVSRSAGVGTVGVFDSYLSPLKYRGLNFGFMYEAMQMLKWNDGKISFQQQYFTDVSQTLNGTETAYNLTLFSEADYAFHYRFDLTENFQVFAGTQAGIFIGGIYNSRNQNNPISLKMNLNLGVSGIAAYRLMLKSQPVRFRYQLGFPAIRMLFAPQFGQSYYYLDGNENIFFASSFRNHSALKNILSVELPLNRITLRATYVHSFYRTKINHLLTQYYSNTFYAGISKNFYSVRAGKKENRNQATVFK